MSDEARAPVPFTVLTGWLGAGKTTVLNRVLPVVSGRKVAVLVNELGRIAIDGRLIVARGGDVLELAGGCLCCKIDVKNDLWDGIADVIRRGAPDQIVLETTGIAEPAVILEGLAARLPEGLVAPAGIVTVVEAEAGEAALAAREEARAQVEHADRVIVSKLDRADADTVARLHRRLDDLNGRAERAAFEVGEAGDRALAAYLLEIRAPGPARGSAAHAHGLHGLHGLHGQLGAMAVRDTTPWVASAMMSVVERWRPGLHRIKGWVALAGEPRRGFLELAGARLELTLGAPWGDAPPVTELVIIGEGLDEAALTRQLAACRAAVGTWSPA